MPNFKSSFQKFVGVEDGKVVNRKRWWIRMFLIIVPLATIIAVVPVLYIIHLALQWLVPLLYSK